MIAHPHSILSRIKLTTQIGALTIVAVLTTSTALLVLAYAELQSDIEQRAVQRQELSVRIGASLLKNAYPKTEITLSPERRVEKIVLDHLPETGDQALVDTITRITGEPATIFGYDVALNDFVRLATTVRKADGSHAVGTVLGKTSAAYGPLRRGEAYSGRAEILGVPYFTDYHPIFNRQGNVIGSIFAGVKEETVAASARGLIWSIALVSAILLAVMATISLAAARVFVRPVPILANVTRRLARQDGGSETAIHAPIPYTNWNNEIGDIANALEVFREQAIEKAKVEASAARAFEELRKSRRGLEIKNREIEEANIKLAFALDNMSRGLSMFDADQRLVVCNSIYRDIYDLPERLAKPGTPLIEILRYDAMKAGADNARAVQLVESWLNVLRGKLARGEAFSEEQTLLDGRILNVTFQPLAHGGWVDLHEDITERRLTEAKLYHMARHDALTDLPNRVFLGEELQRTLSDRDGASGFAVLCLDLDGFKGINDTFGHSVGDSLLTEVAARLSQCVREKDVVARLGGDEFAIVQNNLKNPKDTQILARRILDRIGAPYELDGKRVIVGASIGIAISPRDGEDAATLLKHADLALYRSKSEGRNCFRYFEQQMSDQMQERQSLEQDLREAVAKNELELYYQPQASVETGELIGFEALLRWRHPARGLISPAEFIPLAEETGQIVSIGAWVLKEACRQAQAYPKHLKIAVNVSAVQLKQQNFVETVVLALGETGLPPHRLELEITESVLADHSGSTLHMLQRLSDMGVHIALDDFGTGYSSLSCLRTLPIDKIKIDSSFVLDLHKGGEDALVLLRSIADLGNALGMTICAEGVETEDQLRIVRAEGCTEMQGYLVSPPLPAAAMMRKYFAPAGEERQAGLAG